MPLSQRHPHLAQIAAAVPWWAENRPSTPGAVLENRLLDHSNGIATAGAKEPRCQRWLRRLRLGWVRARGTEEPAILGAKSRNMPRKSTCCVLQHFSMRQMQQIRVWFRCSWSRLRAPPAMTRVGALSFRAWYGGDTVGTGPVPAARPARKSNRSSRSPQGSSCPRP